MPYGVWWNEGVREVHRASSHRVSSRHAALLVPESGRLGLYILRSVAPRVPPFSPLVSPAVVASFQRRKWRSSIQTWELLCFRKAKCCPVGNDGFPRSSVKTDRVLHTDSQQALDPGVTAHSTDSFRETPAGRFQSTHMDLSAKLVMIHRKTRVSESQMELFFQCITNTKDSNSSGWW